MILPRRHPERTPVPLTWPGKGEGSECHVITGASW